MNILQLIKKSLRNLGDLFSDRIWTMDISESTKLWAGAVRLVKLVRITLNTFLENRMGFQCVALSYFVTLAIIPFVAFVFVISDGLGLSDKISDLLYSLNPGNTELVSLILEKSDNILKVAQSGPVGIVSALFFLWAVLWLMFQVERVFNNVWGLLRIPRKLYVRFGTYMILLLLSPFTILLFGTGIAAYSNVTNLIGLDLSDLPFIPKLLGWLAFYIMAALIMSAMYKFIPAVKVRYKYALKSAIVASIFFCSFQYLYLETQVFVARLNTVYGVLAAVPLFLIWLNFSCQIVIYGAVLSYSYHNLNTYNVPQTYFEDKKEIEQ